MSNESIDAKLQGNDAPGYYSVLLAWDERDLGEQGTYSWAGFADSSEHATAIARESMFYANENREIDLDDPDGEEADIPDYYVIDIYEGANMWAAKALFDALLAAKPLIEVAVASKAQAGVLPGKEIWQQVLNALDQGQSL